MNTPILTTLQEENAPWNKEDEIPELKKRTVEVTVYLTKRITIITDTDSVEEMTNKIDDVVKNADFNKWQLDNIDVTEI